MTAATAPSPSPAPSAPPLAPTPTRQSSTDAVHAPTDASTTRRQDPSAAASASPANLIHPASAASPNVATNLGTLAKPIDLASPPGSPTFSATAATSLASELDASQSSSTRPPPDQPTPASSASTPSAPASLAAASSSTAALATPTRLLPPTPLGNPSDRAPAPVAAATPPSATTATPSKQVHLPSPYKAPRIAHSGTSESFATAYPTQETRQKYASPSKPLASLAGLASSTLTHKRSWQSSMAADLANKRFRATPNPTSAPSAPAPRASLASAPSSSSGPSAEAPPRSAASTLTPTSPSNAALATSSSAGPSSRPLPSLPTTARVTNSASGVTITNIPKPGSPLSRQAGVGPLNLIPAVSGTQLPASTRDEFLSLLQKSELIDLVKQLERQLNDLVAAPIGSSALYRQPRIYPNNIHTQIDRLQARQRIESSRTASPSDLSLKDVYSLLNATTSASSTPSSTYARTPGALARTGSSAASTGARNTASVSSLPRRPPATMSVASRSAASAAQQHSRQPAKDTAQSASLTNLINSINAMVRQQAQPARGPNGAPLPPALPGTAASGARNSAAAASKAHQHTTTIPTLPAAALRSIVGDGPMPSNAALAAAIAAHFGGSLPGSSSTPARLPASSMPSSTSAKRTTANEPKNATARGQPAASVRGQPVATASPLPTPGKDISDKIAAILGSSSSAQTTMLGPQGLPLAPAAPASASSAESAALPIGNIAAMLSSFAGQDNDPNPTLNSSIVEATGATSGAEGQGGALASLLRQLEEAKKRLSPRAAASQPGTPALLSSMATAEAAGANTLSDPVAILTGASANPVFTPSYPAEASSTLASSLASNRETSWSPEPDPVIVQGPLGTSTLPSYEDMIVEGLRVMGEAPPRMLFNWMQVTYPLTKKFRPSAHQALQKAFKRGRLLKTGSMYRINPSWSSPGESRKPTRRPQVGRDHPMVTPGLNGEVLAVSPLKDSQAYRNVGDSGLRPTGKGVRAGPRPYGQPGAAPLANPASSIFQNGSAASIILEYQKRTGKKLDADAIKHLYQLIRSGPSDGPVEEMLAYLLTQTGYHDAAATATAAAAAQAAAAAMSASMPPYIRPHASPSSMSSSAATQGGMGGMTGAASAQRRPPVPKGPTSLPLPTTSEPTMMQQLASMLNDLSSPINPVLANSLLGQLSSNAAAAAAARAANMPSLSAASALPSAPARGVAPSPSAPSQLASALSSLAGASPQQDLDSAVSETLAAALQQIGAASSAANPASQEAATKPAFDESTAPKVADGGGASAETAAKAADEPRESDVGIDLAEYEDAIRALTSAFGGAGRDGDEGDSEESDNEADERAIAAAEAEPDSVPEAEAEARMDEPRQAAEESAASSSAVAPPDEQLEAAAEGEDAEIEQEEDEEEGEGEEDAEQMDLSAVLRQLTASLQAHQESEAEAEGGGDAEGVEGGGSGAEDSQRDPGRVGIVEVDQDAASAHTAEHAESGVTEAARAVPEADEQGEEANDAAGGDAASLQAQLEALVASLAANAGDEEDEDEDEDEEEEEEGDAEMPQAE